MYFTFYIFLKCIEALFSYEKKHQCFIEDIDCTAEINVQHSTLFLFLLINMVYEQVTSSFKGLLYSIMQVHSCSLLCWGYLGAL